MSLSLNSELRTAIHVDGFAGDPPSIVRCQEGDDAADVVRPREALQRLHAKREVEARICLGEVQHVRLDDTGRDGIDADTTCAKGRGEMLHQGVDGALSCRIRWFGTNNGARCERREENDAASLRQDRKELLHKKERRADVDREELIEILHRRFLDGRHFQDPCISDKDVQAISDNAAGLPGKLAGAVRGGKIRRYGIRSTTGFAYLCDNTVGFLRAAAVMHENLGAGGASASALARPMPREAPV